MKKQMLIGSRLCATALSMILAFHPVFAQQTQKPDIAVSIFRDLVRFTAPSEVQEMRVEVFNLTGQKVFEGSLVSGQTQDWPLQDLQSQPVDSGLYSYTITTKDQAGALKQMQQGNLIVDRGREGLEAAPPVDSSDARPPQSIKPKPTGSWDVDHGKDPYIINTPAMGIGTQTPLAHLQLGAGTKEPLTKGSTLLLEEGEATGMVLKSTTGAEMFFSQDKKYGLFGTASNHPLGIRTNNLNRFWITGEGNVGIGTINPNSPLTVVGMIETTSGGIKFPDGTIQTTAANGGSDASIEAPAGAPQKNEAGENGTKGVTPAGSDGDWSLSGNAGTTADNFLGTTKKQPLIFKTHGEESMRIDGISGNVGIGNAMPFEKLSIGGRIHIAGNCGGGVPDVQGAHISWNQLRSGLDPCGIGETDLINHRGGGPGGFAFINTGKPGTDLSTLMFISDRGVVGNRPAVGIGTVTPDTSLTIANTAGANYTNVKDGTHEILLGVDAAGGILSTMTNHDLTFRAGVNSEKMRIAANGNVGIGMKTFPSGLGTVLSVASTKLDGGGVTVGGSGLGEVLYLYADTTSNYAGIQVKRPNVITDNLILQEQGGNVGIGRAGSGMPTHKLEIAGNSGNVLWAGASTGSIANVDLSGHVQLREFNTGGIAYLQARDDSSNRNIGLRFRTQQAGTSTPSIVDAVTIGANGNVGIGTSIFGTNMPARKLEVDDPFPQIRLKSTEEGGRTFDFGVGTNAFAIQEYASDGRPLGIPLWIEGGTGVVSVPVLQITGGSDLSEQFEVKAAANGAAIRQRIEPGMVVSIDDGNLGKLMLSSQAYDRKVAGIISGAGGIRPGMRMGQSGSVADGSHPIALSGRVYCWADATNRPINPGDLLTTSNIPGHAMKVTNHTKALGAIIGKAMTSLTQGRGLVLVLVSLQ
jgi:hypothetical protein